MHLLRHPVGYTPSLTSLGAVSITPQNAQPVPLSAFPDVSAEWLERFPRILTFNQPAPVVVAEEDPVAEAVEETEPPKADKPDFSEDVVEEAVDDTEEAEEEGEAEEPDSVVASEAVSKEDEAIVASIFKRRAEEKKTV